MKILRPSQLENIDDILNDHFAISITDIDGRIIHVNPLFEHWTGYSLKDLKGKTHSVISSGYHNKAFFKEMWQTISKGEIWCKEICNQRQDGYNIWLKMKIVPLLDEANKIIAYYSFSNETTERKMLDQKLQKEKKKSEHADIAKSNFLSILSHEMLTPLNAIMGFTDILEFEIESEAGKKYLNHLKNANKRLEKTLNDTLTLSNIMTGRIHVLPRPVNLKNFFKTTIYKTEFLYRDRPIDFHFDFPENHKDLSLSFDEGHTASILEHLLDNAYKFTEKGSVTLSIQLDKIENNWQLAIHVMDIGIGFEKKYKKEIFKNFTQVDSSITRKHEGAGLGLPLSLNLAKLMNAEILIDSIPNKGSTFTLLFPKLKENDEQ